MTRLTHGHILGTQDEVLCNRFILTYAMAVNKDAMDSYERRILAAESLVYIVMVPKASEPTGFERVIKHLDFGPAYRNGHAATEQIFCLNEVVKDLDCSRVRNQASGLIGCAADEATDISTEQGLIIYVKFEEHGKTQTLFLGIQDLPAQDAATIFETIQQYVAERLFEGDVKKMHQYHMTIGTDGCSSMVGRNNGVTAKFKQQNPRVVAVWCHAHRLALVMKDAFDAITGLEDFEDLLRSFYNFFGRSVKRKKALTDAQKEQGEKVLRMIRDIPTRWLSKGLCVKRLKEIYFPLHQVLSDGAVCAIESPEEESESRPGRRGQLAVSRAALLENLGSHFFLTLLDGMNDVLHWSNELSKVLQERNLTGTKVKLAVDSLVKGLTLSWVTQGPRGLPLGGLPTRNLCRHIQSVLSCDQTSTIRDVYDLDARGGTYTLSNGRDYEITVRCNLGDHTAAMKVIGNFVTNMVENVGERLGDASDYSLFDCFAPSSFPRDPTLRLVHGDSEITKLIEKYGKDIQVGTTLFPARLDGDKLCSEWDNYKSKIAELGLVGGDIQDDEEIISRILKDDSLLTSFPNVFFLYKLKLILWLETAECERGFSVRTQIKTKHRASMNNVLLDALMRLTMNGPSLDNKEGLRTLIVAAVQLYKSVRNRFPQRSGAGVARTHDTHQGGGAFAALKGYADLAEAASRLVEQDQPSRSISPRDIVPEVNEQREDRDMERTQLDAVPAYVPDAEWKVLELLPEDVAFPGVPNVCKATDAFLKTRHVACKSLNGWDRGTVHMQETSKRNKGLFSIKVPSWGRAGWLLYDLKKDTYKKDWVLLDRC